MSFRSKITIFAIFLLVATATSIFLFRYAPLTVALPLYPASGLAEVRIKGYLQETALGPYILWDENCTHTTVAVLSDDLQNQNEIALSDLDLNRVPAKARKIAKGTYYGNVEKNTEHSKSNHVFIRIKRMEIEKVSPIEEEFSDSSKCEMVE